MKELFDKRKADRMAAEWRYIITDMICRSGSGHLGGALSIVEILYTLYFRIMKVDPTNPKWPGRDRLVLSKGHAAPALYMALAEKGFFPKKWLKTLNMNGTKLPSHADARTVPGIDATTGSLGQGLSVACGMSWAAKLNKQDHNIFCIIGDGESNEGQNWEAAMFGAHHKLDSLVAITDYNKLQIDGRTDDILSLEPLHDKWKAFGWEVFEMGGHDWEDIYNTLKAAKEVKGKPSMVIAHTVKARGCSIVEAQAGSHNIKVPDREAYEKYMNALEARDVELPY